MICSLAVNVEGTEGEPAAWKVRTRTESPLDYLKKQVHSDLRRQHVLRAIRMEVIYVLFVLRG